MSISNRLKQLIIMSLLVMMLIASPASAQSGVVQVTIAAPEWMNDVFNDDLMAEFEAAYPNIDVSIAYPGDSMFFPSAAWDAENYFESLTEYANTADILYVDNYNLGVEATRGGFFLDLVPLVNSDTTFDRADFIPSVLQSFEWDGSLWAIPMSGQLQVLIYNPERFDELGIPYPTESWTIDDYANAMRALTEVDAEGEVVNSGFMTWGNDGLLLRALTGRGVYDDSVIPNMPNFQNPALESLLTIWVELTNDGYMNRGDFGGQPGEVPLSIDGLRVLNNFFGPDSPEMAAALLPGGVAGMQATGFAVSAGSQAPGEAYEFIKWLSSNINVVSRFFGDTPARLSLIGVEPEEDVFFTPELSEEAAAFRDQALAVALPASELRFMDYVTNAISRMSPEGDNLDARAALDEAETAAIVNLQAADEQRSTVTLFVPTPEPAAVLQEGEITLKFGMTSFSSPMPNRDQWEAAIADFIANDPQVGDVEWDSGFRQPSEFIDEGYDCFVMPYNMIVGNSISTSDLLNLDPFMDADPNFSRADFMPGVLPLVQRDNLTWAYPMSLQPEVLWYNGEMFDEAGAIRPEQGWTLDEFLDTLQVLRVDPNDEAPFKPSGAGGNYMLMLIAAYGGLPIDYRTTPYSYNFTDPTNVAAIQQALDLARDGYIDYQALGNFGGSFFSGGGSDIAIYNDNLNSLVWRVQNAENVTDFEDPMRLTSYPRGSQLNAVSFDITTGYIPATSQAPDACFRLLNMLAITPELFNSMPARQSGVATATADQTINDGLMAMYEMFAQQLSDPNTLIFPSVFGGSGEPNSFIIQTWLYRAFDAYVEEDADLNAALTEAQTLADAYRDCTAALPPFDPQSVSELTPDEQISAFRPYAQCAVTVDPTLETMFGMILGEDDGS